MDTSSSSYHLPPDHCEHHQDITEGEYRMYEALIALSPAEDGEDDRTHLDAFLKKSGEAVAAARLRAGSKR